MAAGAESPLGSYDERTALLLVDVQNDFADPGGSLYVSGGEETIPAVNAEIAAAKAAGSLIVYSQDWHPESTPHFEKDGGVWPVHCVAGSRGAELHPDLRVEGPVVRKGTAGEDGYSAFSVRDPVSGERDDTELDRILRSGGIRRVVIAGLALDYCVKETVLDARRKGYEAELLADLTRPVNRLPGDGARSVAEVVAAGAHVR